MAAMMYRLTSDDPVAEEFDVTALRTEGRPGEAETRRAVEDALASPVEFPALRQSIVEGDHVAIALDGSTPSAAAIVDTLIGALLADGVTADHLTVVTDTPQTAAGLSELEESRGVTVEIHDPADEEQLCFAGLTKAERELRVNRTLFEADLVLPVTTEHVGDRADGGPYDGVFPRFFDRETVERVTRVRSVAAAQTRGGDYASARRREADEAGWMLGAPLQVRVIPGLDGQAETVVFGEAVAAHRRARELAADRWLRQAATTVPLVIAQLDSTATGWGDMARALAVAEELMPSGGATVLWCETDEPMGPALACLVEAEDPDQALGELAELSGDEALFAWRLAEAVTRGPVFWRSSLPPETVEELGASPLTDEAELARLAERYGECVLLQQPQHLCLGLPDRVEAET